MREFFLWLLFIVGGFLSGSVMFSANSSSASRHYE